MYTWQDMIPLTCMEAQKVMKLGLQVVCLRPNKKTHIAANQADIIAHAVRGGCFAVNAKALADANTYYVAHYTLMAKDGVTELKAVPVRVSRRYADRYDAVLDCKRLLSDLIRKHRITAREVWAVKEFVEYRLGEERTTDYDEGIVEIENGAAVKVPLGFELPF